MEKIFTGDLVSYTTQIDVMDEIAERAPRTFALAIGAAILWMVVADRARALHRDEGRASSPTAS